MQMTCLHYDMTTILSWDAFNKQYNPVRNTRNPKAMYEGAMFDLIDADISFVAKQHKEHVWTIMDDDTIRCGNHSNHQLGYIVTRIPWQGESGDINVDMEL